MSALEQHSTQPGVVVAHVAEIGATVSEGDPLLVLESMKCEQRVLAETSGRLNWLAPIGSVVVPGGPIARLAARRTVRPPAPDELIEMAVAAGPDGTFERRDLAPSGPDRLVPVDALHDAARDPGSRRAQQVCGVTAGIISHRFDHHSAPVRRVWLCGDSTSDLGAVAEPECRRILAAIDLAEAEGLPLEWVTVSAGARVSMTSGTENMDWCAAVVRRLVEFTQLGGEVIIVVAGVNVGAQSYWNAEATMLMHCAGTLVMVDGTAMVLTGSRSLSRAGGLSEASDHDLGGVGVMGANGQAHHVVPDLASALELVVQHHAVCASGPLHPRTRTVTADDAARDVRRAPYTGSAEHGWSTIGEILSVDTHPNRNRPFEVRPVMDALADSDAPRLERWSHMEGADGAVVWDTRIDGWGVSLIGIESCPRSTEDGWEAAGTLYPMASKKVARALQRASGRRPAVVVANLAGFDGSRESLAGLQLEHGAELARAVVNFRGPIIVVVVGRFHGGAYVVLSRQLNPELRLVALTGTRVSVIGGGSAAEVVLRSDVDAEMEHSGCSRDEAISRVAHRFDSTHDVRRAQEVGSVDMVIDPEELRLVLAEMVAAPVSSGRRVPQPADRNAVPA